MKNIINKFFGLGNLPFAASLVSLVALGVLFASQSICIFSYFKSFCFWNIFNSRFC